MQTVVNALKEHRRKLDDLVAQKSLVLSLHGAMGTGKNHMADIIAANMFMMGKKSVYVYEFDGNTLHEQKVSHFVVLLYIIRPLLLFGLQAIFQTHL